MAPANISVDTFNEASEMQEDLPPISTCLSSWKFWLTFALWPIVFLLFNGIVIATLVVVNEYVFRNWHPRMYENGTRGNLLSFLCLLDAFVLFRAIAFLEKDIRELDLMREVNDEYGEDRLNSTQTQQHIHAQVSRKADVFLGRGLRPRVSIFISVLWLATIACSTHGLASFAHWSFKKICLSSLNEFYDPTGLPDELKNWGTGRQYRFDEYFMNGGVVQMTDGTNYFAAKDQFGINSKRWFNPFFPHVLEPHQFVNVMGDDALNSDCFCCVYQEQPPAHTYGHEYEWPHAVMCVYTEEDVGDGVFRNVSFTNIIQERLMDDVVDRFVHVSITPFTQELWVQLVYQTYGRYAIIFVVDFYKINPVDMNLVSVVNSTITGMDEHPSSCLHWINFINRAVSVLVLLAASYWMLRAQKMPAGVVPACAAGAILLINVNEFLWLALSFMAACTAMLGLVGLIPTPFGREVLIWGLYTLLVLTFVCNLFLGIDTVVLIAVIVGFVLNHPVLYLLSWIGEVRQL